MKGKSFNKKLTLNKKTIVNLNRDELEKVYGGKTDTWYPSCNTTCIVDC